MGASGYTPNLHLPQWSDSDKPSWLGDLNAAFRLVDNAHSDLLGQVATLQARVTSLESRVTALEAAAARVARMSTQSAR